MMFEAPREILWRVFHRAQAGLVPATAEDRRIVRDLREEGVHVTDLEALGIPGSRTMFERARSHFDGLETPTTPKNPRKGYIVHVPGGEVEQTPEILSWGLDERLLVIIERYLGAPVAFRGAALRRDLADGTAVETRLWHRDAEDRRIVKIIVYLSEVGPTGGPFECIPKNRTPPESLLTWVDGRVSDEVMAQAISPADIRSCHGPAGTVVFTDTCNVLHRGSVPERHHREAVFFAYNSTTPRRPEYCPSMFDRAAFLENAPTLTPRQRDSISYTY